MIPVRPRFKPLKRGGDTDFDLKSARIKGRDGFVFDSRACCSLRGVFGNFNTKKPSAFLFMGTRSII
jgi:hypothetical protein